MAQVGEPVGTATPAETLAQLREHSDLSIRRDYPAQAVSFIVCYDDETATYTDRVYVLGGDPNDPDDVLVDEEALSEEDLIFRFGVLDEREEAAKNDPMAAIMAQIMAQMGGGVED
jgi:hypothetical protein